jgi:hypothetical protein
MSLGVKILIGVGLVFAIATAGGPLFGVLGFFSGWHYVADAGDVEPTVATPGGLSAARWSEITSDPTAYRGEHVTVYGQITAAPQDGGRAVRAFVGPESVTDPFPTLALVTQAAGLSDSWDDLRPGDVVRIVGTVQPPGNPDDVASPRIVIVTGVTGLELVRR